VRSELTACMRVLLLFVAKSCHSKLFEFWSCFIELELYLRAAYYYQLVLRTRVTDTNYAIAL